MAADLVRPDHGVIADLVEPGARVLDLGCGTGELLELLARTRGAVVQGIELDEQSVYACVGRGLPVFHGDIDSGLADYPDGAFDYVILNQSLQEVRHVNTVIAEALRVGKKVVIGFPNFAYLPARWSLFAHGRTPVTPSLPYRWHDTPNLRFLTVRDFQDFCREKGLKVLAARYLGNRGEIRVLPNLRALNAVFVIAA